MSAAKLNEPNHTIISRSRSTKVVRDQKQWRAIFEARRASGLSVEKFCSANNIARSAYWKWSKRLDATKSAAATNAIAPTFLPIPISAAPSASVELELGAMRVRLDGAATQRVIDAIIQRIATHA